MSLVVPAEKTDAVHAETDRVERILVVDDDVRLRTLLQRFLEDKGFVVKTAHDADSNGLRLCAARTFLFDCA